MLDKQMRIRPELAELIVWFIETVEPLVDENGWSVTVNGNAGTLQTDVRRTARTATDDGEERTEVRRLREFRLKRTFK